MKTTPRNKGLTLTLKVTAYDNGMVEVDGIPINVEPHHDAGRGWLGAAHVITTNSIVAPRSQHWTAICESWTTSSVRSRGTRTRRRGSGRIGC